MPYDPTPGGDQYFPSIQWNAAGAPYQISASGKIVYITPTAAATADPNNPVGAKMRAWAATHGATYANPGTDNSHNGGFWHERDRWDGGSNSYQTGGLDWGSVMTMVVAGFLTAGAADIIMGAPAGTAAAAQASGTVPTGTSGAVTGAAAAGTGPATTAATVPTTMGIESATSLGLPATSGLGTAGTTAAAATGATAATKYGPFADGYGDATTGYDIPPGLDPNYTGDVGGYSPNGPYADRYANPTTTPNVPGSLIKNGLATLPEHASPILKALAAVGGLLGGKYLGDQAAENAVPPQLTQLLDLAMQRANSQTPLFNATQKGFYDMLPTFARQGGGK